MPRYYVIGWRAPGMSPYFFRGDNRYPVYLPYVSEESLTKGWVTEIARARVFEGFPCLNKKSYSKHLDVTRIRIYPYEEEILPTQIYRPIKRPNPRNFK